MVWGRPHGLPNMSERHFNLTTYCVLFPAVTAQLKRTDPPSSRLPKKRLRPCCASRPCCCSLRLAQPTWRPALRPRPPVPVPCQAAWCSSSSCWRRRRTAERERCWRADLVPCRGLMAILSNKGDFMGAICWQNPLGSCICLNFVWTYLKLFYDDDSWWSFSPSKCQW